jgi:hypothetical protein
MQKIIFAKCSVERKEEYRIITRILEANGKRTVEKQAVGEKARPYVERMAEFAKTNPYRTERVRLVPCEKTGDGKVSFPYVEGKRLDQVIDEAVQNKQWDEVWEHVRLLKNIIMDVRDVEPFHASEAFTGIFGEAAALEGYDSAGNVSLDMVSANIVLSDFIYVLDYEWTFDFAVPLKFILYRSILLNGTLNVIPEEQKKILMEIVGISHEESELFLQMEIAFQQFVTGVSLKNLYPQMPTKYTIVREENYCNEPRKSLPRRAAGKVKRIIVSHREV